MLIYKNIKNGTIVQGGHESVCTDKYLCAGRWGEKSFSAYLLFNIEKSRFAQNADSALLKLFVLRIFSNEQYLNLYIEISNSHGDMCCRSSLSVPVNHCCRGWIFVNLDSSYHIFENDGLYEVKITISDESSLINFARCRGKEPSLIVNMQNCGGSSRRSINVVEKKWKACFKHEVTTPPINVSRLKQGSYYINNKGKSTITVILETSADLSGWVKDMQKTLLPETTEVMVAKYFGKYDRLSLLTDQDAEAEVVFIAQMFS